MLVSGTLADSFKPLAKRYAIAYEIFLVLGGSIIIALSAQLAIGWPVPITGQTFAVLMLAALYGRVRAITTVLAYIIEGLAGLPVFAGFKFGPAALFGPTGGYIIGFLAAAYIVGALSEKGWDRFFGKTVISMCIGNAVIYAFGLSWLYCLLSAGKIAGSFNTMLERGLFLFIPGDLLKIILAAILLPAGWKTLSKFSANR